MPFNGKYYKGYMKKVREQKRIAAELRNEATAEINRRAYWRAQSGKGTRSSHYSFA